MKKKISLFLMILCLGVLTACSQSIPGLGGATVESSSEDSSSTNEESLEEGTKVTLEIPGYETQSQSDTSESVPDEMTETDETEEVLEDPGKDTEGINKEDIETRIAIATDIHYLAKELCDEGESFQAMLQNSDGMLTQYGWEILMAFLEDIEKEQPDVLILSGDLTKNGEKKSHEALADRLRRLEKKGIPVVVIPGNHDINSPYASGYRKEGTYPVENISAQQFRDIYKEFGYKEAISEDPASLSYIYPLNEYTWLLMIDSCQYDPVNQVGGMIQEGTYQWIEEKLEVAWDEGIRVIPVTHHNLLEQTQASEEFIQNCTIEHDERLIHMWEDNDINLHLSGHLHIQHYTHTQEEPRIYEVVTGALMMYPCKYGILEILVNGDLNYYTKKVEVEKWAKKYGKKDRELLNFDAYAKEFLYDISYWNVYYDLQAHGLSVADSESMAKLYARLNPNFYSGTIPNTSKEILQDPAYKLWKDSEYFSEVATTIQTMIQEENHDYNTLYIPY